MASHSSLDTPIISRSALKLTDAIQLPPRPQVLATFTEEMESSSPDADRIVATLNNDAGLYGAVLQVVNSPYFGLKVTVTSIKQAVMLLGLSRVYTIVRSAALRSSLGGSAILERFWETSIEVAKLSMVIAERLTKESPDDAYTLGMFHDAGVPLMMLAFPKYRRVIKKAIDEHAEFIPDVEMIQFGCHRYHVGHRLAKKWHLPDFLSEAILFQIDVKKAISKERESLPHTPELLAVLTLAKHFSGLYQQYWKIEQKVEFETVPQEAVDYLGLNEAAYIDLQNSLLAMLKSEQSD